jgi:hypothetical protein
VHDCNSQDLDDRLRARMMIGFITGPTFQNILEESIDYYYHETISILHLHLLPLMIEHLAIAKTDVLMNNT